MRFRMGDDILGDGIPGVHPEPIQNVVHCTVYTWRVDIVKVQGPATIKLGCSKSTARVCNGMGTKEDPSDICMWQAQQAKRQRK